MPLAEVNLNRVMARGCLALLAFAILLAPCSTSLADTKAEWSKLFREEFESRRKLYESNRMDTKACWQFAKAAFDWADFAEDSRSRAEIAREGISAAREAVDLDPESAEAHYFLAMNLGQLARTKTLGALPLVTEMEAEFKRAIELNPRADFAGPHRSLGRLYLEAPGWPTSVGSRTKARKHLEKAVELAPNYPGNHLALAESYHHWGERKILEAALKSFETVLPKAREEFTGPIWERDWADWNATLTKLRSWLERQSRASPTQGRK